MFERGSVPRQGFGFRVCGLGGSGAGASGFCCRVQGFGGLGFRGLGILRVLGGLGFKGLGIFRV